MQQDKFFASINALHHSMEFEGRIAKDEFYFNGIAKTFEGSSPRRGSFRPLKQEVNSDSAIERTLNFPGCLISMGQLRKGSSGLREESWREICGPIRGGSDTALRLPPALRGKGVRSGSRELLSSR